MLGVDPAFAALYPWLGGRQLTSTSSYAGGLRDHGGNCANIVGLIEVIEVIEEFPKANSIWKSGAEAPEGGQGEDVSTPPASSA